MRGRRGSAKRRATEVLDEALRSASIVEELVARLQEEPDRETLEAYLGESPSVRADVRARVPIAELEWADILCPPGEQSVIAQADAVVSLRKALRCFESDDAARAARLLERHWAWLKVVPAARELRERALAARHAEQCAVAEALMTQAERALESARVDVIAGALADLYTLDAATVAPYEQRVSALVDAANQLDERTVLAARSVDHPLGERIRCARLAALAESEDERRGWLAAAAAADLATNLRYRLVELDPEAGRDVPIPIPPSPDRAAAPLLTEDGCAVIPIEVGPGVMLRFVDLRTLRTVRLVSIGEPVDRLHLPDVAVETDGIHLPGDGGILSLSPDARRIEHHESLVHLRAERPSGEVFRTCVVPGTRLAWRVMPGARMEPDIVLVDRARGLVCAHGGHGHGVDLVRHPERLRLAIEDWMRRRVTDPEDEGLSPTRGGIPLQWDLGPVADAGDGLGVLGLRAPFGGKLALLYIEAGGATRARVDLKGWAGGHCEIVAVPGGCVLAYADRRHWLLEGWARRGRKLERKWRVTPSTRPSLLTNAHGTAAALACASARPRLQMLSLDAPPSLGNAGPRRRPWDFMPAPLPSRARRRARTLADEYRELAEPRLRRRVADELAEATPARAVEIIEAVGHCWDVLDVATAEALRRFPRDLSVALALVEAHYFLDERVDLEQYALPRDGSELSVRARLAIGKIRMARGDTDAALAIWREARRLAGKGRHAAVADEWIAYAERPDAIDDPYRGRADAVGAADAARDPAERIRILEAAGALEHPDGQSTARLREAWMAIRARTLALWTRKVLVLSLLDEHARDEEQRLPRSRRWSDQRLEKLRDRASHWLERASAERPAR